MTTQMSLGNGLCASYIYMEIVYAMYILTTNENVQIGHIEMASAYCDPGSLTHWKIWYPSLFSSLQITPFCGKTLTSQLKTTPFSR